MLDNHRLQHQSDCGASHLAAMLLRQVKRRSANRGETQFIELESTGRRLWCKASHLVPFMQPDVLFLRHVWSKASQPQCKAADLYTRPCTFHDQLYSSAVLLRKQQTTLCNRGRRATMPTAGTLHMPQDLTKAVKPGRMTHMECVQDCWMHCRQPRSTGNGHCQETKGTVKGIGA